MRAAIVGDYPLDSMFATGHFCQTPGILSRMARICEFHECVSHYQYQRLYPQNYYFVKYEDLVGDPKTCLKKL